MFLPARSCEPLDLLKCELKADPKSGARRAKVRCEVRAKIKINAVLVKCLCVASYNDHMKVEPRTQSKGGVGMSCLPWKRQIIQLLGVFRTFHF